MASIKGKKPSPLSTKQNVPTAPNRYLRRYHMPYSAFPPDQKRAIDMLHQAMMQHKRTILQVSTMAPKLLEIPSTTTNQQQADAAAGQDIPLATNVHHLSTQVHHIQQQLQSVQQIVDYTKKQYEKSTLQAVMFAKWPTEAVAMRRGVPLSKPTTNISSDSKTNADLQVQLRDLLDREMVHVDRVERMPSPYLWQVLEEMEQRLVSLKAQMESLNKALDQSKQIPIENVNVTAIVKLQEQSIWKVAADIAAVHRKVDQLRHSYRMYEKGSNVLELAEQADREHQKHLEHQMRQQMVKAMPANAAPTPGAPPPGGTFGAPSGGSLFGSTPAPSSGGLFGSTPAAPGSGGLFGNTPVPPAPGGFGFGSAPAPAAGGGLFGSAPAAPAAPGGFLGSTPAPAAPGAFGAPAGGSLFGSTTAAPAAGGSLFGSTPVPAPAGGFGFGSSTTASSSSSTPKSSKNKSRSSRRR
jgi:hypothetical protein